MSAPGMASLEVPVMRKVGPGGPDAGGKVVEVVIWTDTCQGVDQGDAIAAWLSTFLELVRAWDKHRIMLGRVRRDHRPSHRVG